MTVLFGIFSSTGDQLIKSTLKKARTKLDLRYWAVSVKKYLLMFAHFASYYSDKEITAIPGLSRMRGYSKARLCCFHCRIFIRLDLIFTCPFLVYYHACSINGSRCLGLRPAIPRRLGQERHPIDEKSLFTD